MREAISPLGPRSSAAEEPFTSALILGSGAGLEVHIARAAAVPDVEAVELNPAIVRLVRRWKGFGGPIYDQPGVTLFVDEARKFVLIGHCLLSPSAQSPSRFIIR